MKLNPSATKVAIVLDTPFTVALLSSTDGSVLFSYKDPSSYNGFGNVLDDGLLVDDLANIFIAMKGYDNSWEVVKIEANLAAPKATSLDKRTNVDG